MSKTERVRILSRDDGAVFTYSKTLAKRADMRNGWMLVTIPTNDEVRQQVPEDKIRETGEDICRDSETLSAANDRQVFKIGLEHWRDKLTKKEVQLDKPTERAMNPAQVNQKYQEAMAELQAAQSELASLRAQLGVKAPVVASSRVAAKGVTVVDEANMPDLGQDDVPDLTVPGESKAFVPTFAPEDDAAVPKTPTPKRKG